MGYTTDFSGRINIDKKLDNDTYEFLKKLASTRRMKRKVDAKYGVDGEFYVDGIGDFGQGDEKNIVDQNTPPSTQPGLWLQWVPTKDRMGIEWDGGEKFYNSAEWMQYIINRILAPKGYVCDGSIEAQGEDTSDHWWINVNNNVVTTEDMQSLLEAKEKLMIIETPKKDLPLLINHKFLSDANKDLYRKRLTTKKVK